MAEINENININVNDNGGKKTVDNLSKSTKELKENSGLAKKGVEEMLQQFGIGGPLVGKFLDSIFDLGGSFKNLNVTSKEAAAGMEASAVGAEAAGVGFEGAAVGAKAAGTAMESALISSGIGIALIAIVEGVKALSKAFAAASADSKEFQKNIHDANIETGKAYANIVQLVEISQDNTRSTQEQNSAQKQAVDILKDYNPELTTATYNTKELTKALEGYKKALEDQAKAKAYQSKLEKDYSEIADLEIKKSELQEQVDTKNYSNKTKWLRITNNLIGENSVESKTNADIIKERIDNIDVEIKKIQENADKIAGLSISDQQHTEIVVRGAKDQLEAITTSNDQSIEGTKEGSKERIKAEKEALDKIKIFYEQATVENKKYYELLGMNADQYKLFLAKENNKIVDDQTKFDDDAKKTQDDKNKKYLENYKKLLDTKLKKLKAANQLEILNTKENSKERLIAQQTSASSEIALYESVEKNHKTVYENMGITEEEWQLQKKQILDQAEKDEKAYNQYVIDQANKTATEKLELQQLQANDAISKLEADKALIDQKAAIDIQAAKDDVDQIALIQAKAKEDKDKLDQDYNNKELTAKDNLEVDKLESERKGLEKKKQLTDEFIEKEREAKVKQLEDQEAIELQNTELTEQQKVEIIQKYADQIKDINEGAADQIKQLQADSITSVAGAVEKGLEIAKQAVGAISDIIDSSFENQENQLKNQEASMDAAEARELNNKNLSEKQKAAIENKYGKAKVALSNKLKKKEFNSNKTLGIINAAISTAEGIAKAVGENPMAGGLPGSAIAAAIGAAQIAAIAAKKFNPDSYQEVSAGSGGGISNPSVGGQQDQTPQFNSATFAGLGQRNSGIQQKLEAQRVYVLETDITNTQNKVSVIESRAKIG